MFIALTCLFLCSYSQNWVDTNTSTTTTIYFDQYATASSIYFADKTTQIMFIFSNDTPVTTKYLVVDFLNYTLTSTPASLYFNDSFNATTLNSVTIKPKVVTLYNLYMKQCFGYINALFSCSSEDDCSSPNSIYLYIYNSSSSLIIDDYPGLLVYMKFNVDNYQSVVGYPFTFVGSAVHMLEVDISFSTNPSYLSSLSGKYYLFTSILSTSIMFTNDFGVEAKAICSRENEKRYLLFNVDEEPFTDCSCWAKNNDTEMTFNTLFNYPDCFNLLYKPAYDLILPEISTTVTLANGLLYWNSITFSSPNQILQLLGSSYLYVSNLDLNQENLLIKGCMLNVTNLTISKLGTVLDTISFENIFINKSIEIDAVLLTYNYTTLNFDGMAALGLFPVFLQHQSYSYVVYQGDVCETNGSIYVNTDYVTNEECNSSKVIKNNKHVLSIPNSVSYYITENEYWNILTIGTYVIINGTGSLHANVCEFQTGDMTIYVNFHCKKIRVSIQTRITAPLNTDIIIDTIIVHNFKTSTLNTYSIFESTGKVELSHIEMDLCYKTDYNECFDVISSSIPINLPTISSSISTLMLLSNNQLLRVCPSNNTDYEVICITDDTYNFTNYAEFPGYHCPCYDNNCIINVRNGDLDLKGMYFYGTIVGQKQYPVITNIKYINKIEITGFTFLEKDPSIDRMTIINIIGSANLFIKGDCNLYSSIEANYFTPLANVYFFNESLYIKRLNVTSNDYVPITITSNVKSINITYIVLIPDSIWLSEGIIIVEESSEILIVPQKPTYSFYSYYSNPFILMKQQSRKLNYIDDILCDNQAIILNPNNTICNDYNLYEHYCYLPCSSEGNYYQNDYVTIDYSCPCNKNDSNCIVELDRNEIISYSVDLNLTTLIAYQDSTIQLNEYSFTIQVGNDVDITFDSINNNVIYINDESFDFTLNVPLTGQLLLLGSLNKFSQSITKSATTIQSLKISTEYYCRVLLIEDESNECLVCDALSNLGGTCTNTFDLIENCQTQTGFGCEVCYEGYESKIKNCTTCSEHCLRCTNDKCLNCDTNYQLNDMNQCVLISEPIISFYNNKTMKCNDGYYSDSISCIQCDDNCISCDSSGCLTCYKNYTLDGLGCRYIEENNGEELVTNYGVIDCVDGYYLNQFICESCSSSLFDINCKSCDIDGCLSCKDGYALIENESCSNETKSTINDSISISCYDSGSWYNGIECVECGNNCNNCINGQCIECEENYILVRSNTCIYGTDVMPDYCLDLTYRGTCKRCEDGYFVNAYNFCERCPNECTSCHNSTYCFECIDDYVINYYNGCVDKHKFLENCYHPIPGSSGGCAVCNSGYYRLKTTCFECIDNCTTCHNDYECTICNDNYFVVTDLSECISYDELTNCNNKTQTGCSECTYGYYLEGQYCNSCESKTSNCNTCNKRNGECLTCSNDYVIVEYECIHYQSIDNCKEAQDSKCTSCSFWHTPTMNGDGCETQVVWWVIVLIILFFVFIFTCIVIISVYFVNKYLNHRKLKNLEKEVTVFDMKHTNIQFISTENKDVVINKNEILFNNESEEIGVNEETRDIVCVGNTSKHTIKVQFSVKDGCDKYEIRTDPQLVAIPKGKACEFEIFIKPLCTCKINDQVMLISTNLKKGKTINTPIYISTQTLMTSHLDYEELIEDKKLGEGAFGIVYKGTFRGNQVAIKKMKEASDDELSMNEFSKEVAMLDKFRCDYIVHFYGAVFILNKICMVTEFAQYGSLQDLMNKRKKELVSNSMKLKITKDAAKGIEYLHSNGILHRDIKPDNMLVLSLEENVPVNAKLTDFGSSRNVNTLMCNKTFTKGIGSPAYMAPEVLKRSKYQATADIFSFAVTMYETFDWKSAYPNTEYRFKFPWKIAEFVTKGERLEQTKNINDGIYDLISNCWKHTPEERLQIKEIVERLESIN
ncbi:Protein kinase domain containing protein [Entamoeba marina]